MERKRAESTYGRRAKRYKRQQTDGQPETPASSSPADSLRETVQTLKRSRSSQVTVTDMGSAKRPKSMGNTPEQTDTSMDRTLQLVPVPTPGSASPSFYATPHPSALASALKFALQSSRPKELGEMSPLPALSSRKRTSSRNLKENRVLSSHDLLASDRKLKHVSSKASLKSLESPFSSRPGSTASSPNKGTFANRSIEIQTVTKLKPIRSLTTPAVFQVSPSNSSQRPAAFLQKRTLSDSSKNPNLPSPKTSALRHIQSTSFSSNNHAYNQQNMSPSRLRRPSAPSLPRYPLSQDPALTQDGLVSVDPFARYFAKASDSFESDQDEFSLSFSSGDIDFNRPPSNLSFYEGFEDGLDLDDKADFDVNFIEGMRGSSTPFASLRHRSSIDDDEEISFASPTPSVRSSISDSGADIEMDDDTQPYYKRSERGRSAWISDSLISPPTSQEWNRPPLASGVGAFAVPSEQEDEEMLSVGSEDRFLPESFLHNQSSGNPDPAHEAKLKSMFQSLSIGSKEETALPKSTSLFSLPHTLKSSSPNKSPLRTRSLESPLRVTPPSKTVIKPAKNRDRRGTIKASDFLPSAFTRRSRSGTITSKPPAVSNQSSKPETLPVPLSAARRTRSGTVVGPSKSLSESSDSESASSSSTCVNMISGDITRVETGDGDQNDEGPEMQIEDSLSFAINEELEESDDELLLKGAWKEPFVLRKSSARKGKIRAPSVTKLSRHARGGPKCSPLSGEDKGLRRLKGFNVEEDDGEDELDLLSNR